VRPDGGQHRSERDERQIHHDGVEAGAGQVACREVPGVDLLEIRHARIAAEPGVELGPPDIDADHVRRAGLEHAVGETAGRGAHVEHVRAAQVERESLERGGEFFAAATHEARRLIHGEIEIVRKLLAGFVEPLRAAAHAAAHDEGLRLGPGGGEPADDEQFVEPDFAWCGHGEG
jgi:hypothetical protein